MLRKADQSFSANYDGATANAIKVGAYHLSYAVSAAEAVQEAQMCRSILNGRHLDYPAVAPTSVDTSLISDTGSSLTLKSGKSYPFKFTPNGITAKPVFTTGNAGVKSLTLII